MVTIDPDQLVIRPLHEDDYEAIVDIDTRAAGRPRHDYIGRKFEQAIQSAGQLGTSYVATTDGEVLGFIMGDVYLGEFGIPGDTATIDTIGVNPDYEGNGIARRLLAEFVNHCRVAGVKRIQTLVEWTDATLLRFFDHMGFVPAKALSLEKSLED
jgi:ribosomal protein S18 acetylase RimI-like enzyme